jgi:2-polyprenyl-6-methoxyphenol hydroxylase-like FAD-dependent oxidoreductase
MESAPVVVVGAGPTGLCAGIALARWGVPCLLVERHPAVSVFPRSRSVHQRTMEIFRGWGIEEAVRSRELPSEPVMVWAPTLAGPELRRLDYVQAADPALSPCRMSSVHQDRLEPVLLDVLSGYPATRVRFGTEAALDRVGADGAELRLTDRRTGASEVVGARFVIAADGAGSPTRERLSIAMHGPDDLGRSLLIRFRADLSRFTGPVPASFYFLTGPTVRALYQISQDDEWVLNAEDPAASGDPAAAVRAAIGADVPLEVLGEPGTWTAGAQVADRFRAGPVLLAGDAAHRLTPVGGMGMNTGVHDVHNLAWKLAAVLAGRAGDGLLDTYEAERRPVALRNVAWSLANWERLRAGLPWPPPGSPNTQAVDLGLDDGRARAEPGCRAPHAWLRDGRSTLDLFGEHFTLLAGPEWTEPARSLDLALPLRVETVEGWREAYTATPTTAVLVRPDGHIAWRAAAPSDEAASALRAGVGDVFGRRRVPS